MKKNIILIILSSLLLNCAKQGKGNVLPLSVFFNNRMLLLLKGTYATDNPLRFEDYANGTGALYTDSVNDSGMDLNGVPLAKDLGIYIDIGEIRISSKFQKGYGGLKQLTTAKETKDFWNFIANQRQVYCTSLYTTNGNQCKNNNGYIGINDLFNGNGVKYPSTDPTAETKSNNGVTYVPSLYYYTGIYIRSIVTTWAKGNGVILTTTFDNFNVTGENIVPRNNYTPNFDATLKNSTPPLLFPLLYSVLDGRSDMAIRGGYDPYILEVRANIKENLMAHTYTDAQAIQRTIVGFSDWNSPHNGEPDMGGNLLARSRVIYPETASKVVITGGTKSLLHYYAIYRDQETYILDELPLSATPVLQGSSTIKYIQDGEYKLYCLGDLISRDGFPDTIIRQTSFSVPAYPNNATITVDLACP